MAACGMVDAWIKWRSKHL